MTSRTESGSGRYRVTVTLTDGSIEIFRCPTLEGQVQVWASLHGDADVAHVDLTTDDVQLTPLTRKV